MLTPGVKNVHLVGDTVLPSILFAYLKLGLHFGEVDAHIGHSLVHTAVHTIHESHHHKTEVYTDTAGSKVVWLAWVAHNCYNVYPTQEYVQDVDERSFAHIEEGEG